MSDARASQPSRARRARLACRRLARSLGWMGMLGAAVLVGDAWLAASAVPAAEARLAAARAQTATALLKARRTEAAASARPAPAEQLAAFYRFFPAEASVRPAFDRIYASARRSGLRLEEGEYKTSADRSGRLVRHELVLPVQGQYPQIRGFIGDALAGSPNLALEHVQFERKSVGSPTVSATIRLVLFLGQPS